MDNMDKRTHIYLTILHLIMFLACYAIIMIMNDTNRLIQIGLLTVAFLLAMYSHINYYTFSGVQEKGKLFLIVEMIFIMALLYFDRSNYQQFFILLLVGDVIFSYERKFIVWYTLTTYLFYFPYMIYVLKSRGDFNLTDDILRDILIIFAIVTIMYLMKLQINARRQYNKLLREKTHTNQEMIKYKAEFEAMAVVKERHRIALMLHNNLGHLLVALNLSFQAEKSLLIKEKKIEKNAFKDVEVQIQETMTLLRRIVEQKDDFFKDLSINEQIDLMIKELSNNTNFNIEYSTHQLNKITQKYKNTVHTIILESVTNALKHSKGNRIIINITCTDDAIHLCVRDNGLGFDKLEYGFGTSEMKKSVLLLGGTFELECDHGCHVKVTIPIEGDLND